MSYRDITYSVGHSLQRFEERYCEILSVEQYHILVDLVRKLIKEKQFTLVKKLTNAYLQYVVNFEFGNIDVIATFLPNKPEKITLITTGTYKTFTTPCSVGASAVVYKYTYI